MNDTQILILTLSSVAIFTLIRINAHLCGISKALHRIADKVDRKHEFWWGGPRG